uniref:Uncharacterized protein n=1 Tax=Globodera rostochiensis TaxID=31243 RepID=A0A914I9I4_GLORO
MGGIELSKPKLDPLFGFRDRRGGAGEWCNLRAFFFASPRGELDWKKAKKEQEWKVKVKVNMERKRKKRVTKKKKKNELRGRRG